LQSHEAYRVDRQSIVRRFDWSVVARQTDDLYAEIAPTRSAPKTLKNR
jgi:hypothetical protein